MTRMIRTVAAVMAAWAMFALAPASAAPGDIFKTDAKATIDIGVDGGVEAVQLSGVPGEDAQRIYSEQIRQWRFEPVLEDGQAVPARAFAEMDVYVIEQDDGSLELSVGRPVFRSPPGTPDRIEFRLASGEAEPFEVVRRHVPRYPTDQAHRGAEAEVVLLVEVGPSGQVVRAGVASAAFKNANWSGHDRAMERFAVAAKRAVERWQFNPSSLESRRVFIPVDFAMQGTDTSAWQRIRPVPAAREAWVAQVLSPEDGPVERVMDVNDQSSRFVLLNPPELPWM